MLLDHEGKPLPPHSEQSVDEARRRFGKAAGLGGPAILLTLASRPVLGATCLTPSAAGSGNHSQHHPATCSPETINYWLTNTPAKVNGQYPVWPGTSYKPDDPFHPLFTASSAFEYYKGGGSGSQSYTLHDVLSSGNSLNNVTDTANIGPYFVMGLLNASAGYYAGVLNAAGPDPSVVGIEDEYARNGYFAPTAGKQWGANEIIAYLQDPGSVF